MVYCRVATVPRFETGESEGQRVKNFFFLARSGVLAREPFVGRYRRDFGGQVRVSEADLRLDDPDGFSATVGAMDLRVVCGPYE